MTTSLDFFPSVPIANSQLRHLRSTIVGQDYQIKIRLPENYANSTSLYPVLYLLDGDHAFAMSTDIVQYLIYGQLIPDLIIASTAYGSKAGPNEGGINMRNRDLVPFQYPDTGMAPGAAEYLEFFEKELIPFIESNYRIIPSDRTLWGYSYGGIFALYALFQKPGLFQKYIVVDGFDDPFFEMEETYAAQHSDLPVRLCVSSPPNEAESLFSRFLNHLNGRNYPNFHSEYVGLSEHGHFAIGGEGLTKGLVSVFQNK